MKRQTKEQRGSPTRRRSFESKLNFLISRAELFPLDDNKWNWNSETFYVNIVQDKPEVDIFVLSRKRSVNYTVIFLKSFTSENRILTQTLRAKENFNLSAEKKRTEKAEINYNNRRRIKPKQQHKATDKKAESALNALCISNVVVASTSFSALPQTNATRISEPTDHATTSNNEQTLITQSNDIPVPTPASTKKPESRQLSSAIKARTRN
ncbi:hypothetical protein GWI33_016662 [Rhynchophorus ferrugineus]|uniref:Uncharacterized protein n=1 Tax=Rhynchophorus ferrugineus TaxID=354439 RepID=A0A834IAQ5_RHYFE|nr:hypothetical protein GWI33_016662 [Rhynchophorus ferrugineus]